MSELPHQTTASDPIHRQPNVHDQDDAPDARGPTAPAAHGASSTNGFAPSGEREKAVQQAEKPGLAARAAAGFSSGAQQTRDVLRNSWVNWLLLFVPAGIAVNYAGAPPAVVFAVNAVAIIPLASLLSFATESVAAKMGTAIGALLNITFGNAVEVIIL